MAGNTNSGRKPRTKKTKPEQSEPENTGVVKIDIPSGLKKDSREYWELVTTELVKRGQYQESYQREIETAALVYGEMKQLERDIAKNGMYYETFTDRKSLVIKERPQHALLTKKRKEIRDFEKTFGLIPKLATGAKARNNSPRSRY